MSIVAPVVDGEIQQTTASSSTSTKTSKSGTNTLGKDDFLQLLVAQMKYQDPLEPTSNTEYIAQYATFSEIEQMQNMSQSVNLDRASSLVGKNVYMKTTNETTGVTSYVYGKVDYVQIENNKAYLSIKDSLYSIDDLDSVVDGEYMDAYNKARDLVTSVTNLPTIENLTIDDKEDVDAVEKVFTEMSDYEKSFIAEDTQKLIKNYMSRMDELEKVADEAAETVIEEFKTALEALPAADSITLEDREAIEKVNKLYTNMNSYQQGKVDEDTKTKLNAYTSKLTTLLADSLKAALAALPSVSDVTLENKAAIEAANALYTGMSEAQKAGVAATDKTGLDNYVNKLKELEAASA